MLERKSVDLGDFSNFLSCCLKCSNLDWKDGGDSFKKILDFFAKEFNFLKLSDSDKEFMQKINGLPDDLFFEIINMGADGDEFSQEQKVTLRLKLFEILKNVVEKESDLRIKGFLTKTADVLQLNQGEKEELLFILVSENENCKLEFDILEMLDVKMVLGDNEKKEKLISASIKKPKNLFFDYLLKENCFNELSPLIAKEMVGKVDGLNSSSLIAIWKLLKASISVEVLLNAMCEKYTEQKTLQLLQAPVKSFGNQPAKNDTIISTFISSRLSLPELNRVGEDMLRKLAEKMTWSAFGESVEIVLDYKMEMLQKMLNSYNSQRMSSQINNVNNHLVSIVKSPTLFSGIVKHLKLEKISDVYETDFYKRNKDNYKFFELFKKELESVLQPKNVSSESESKGPRL